MKVEKYNNEYSSFDITLSDSEKILSVYLGGDDINISCRYLNYRRIEEISFDIPEEESEIYPLFEKLYTNIVSGNVLDDNIDDESTKRKMETQRSYSWYNEIVRNGVVSIISDVYPRNCPNILRISKKDGKITLEFVQENNEEFRQPKNPYCVNINVRQSGSKSYDFCYPFKTLFKDLQHIGDPKGKVLRK